MGSSVEVQMILNAIAALRTELSSRMDRQDQQREAQWKKINDIGEHGCGRAPDHDKLDDRVKSLEIDRAKVLGIVAAVSVVVSVLGWVIERTILK